MAAFGYGTGDFLGGAATRSMPALRALLWAHGIGLVLAIAWVAALGGVPETNDLMAGAGSGLFGLGGLYFLYTGLARGRAAVVAPSAAVVGAAVPVVAGVLTGERLEPMAWVGVMAAFPAILLVSTTTDVPRRAAGLGFGLAAGAFFGGYFVALADTSDVSGLWPLLASRALSSVILLGSALWLRRAWLSVPRGRAGVAVAGAGVLDMVGNIGYLLASRLGSLVVVAVVASLFPAVTVAISRLVYEERLSPSQLLGLVLGVSAVALLSAA